MADTGNTFDDASVKRIADTVRWAESFPRTRSPAGLEIVSFAPGRLEPCKSVAGSDCPPFGLCAVVNMTTLKGDPRPIIQIDRPSSTFSRLYAIAGPDGIKANSYGGISFGPAVRFAFDTGSPSNGDGFGFNPGSWLPTKNNPSCLTVSGIVDSSNKIAYGRLDPINSLIGKIHAGTTLSPGGHATIDVWGGAGGSEAVISSLTIDGRDWILASGETALPAATKVIAHWINGIWYIAAFGHDAGCMTVAGFDLKSISGYTAGVVQFLGHDTSNCLKWFTTGACSG